MDTPDAPHWMTRLEDLVPKVDEVFAVLGARTPGWPDPHPDRPPLEEEYSRVLDQGKYAILGARVDSWVRVLADADLAQTVDEVPAPWIDQSRPVSGLARVRRIRPTRPGGLSLVVADTLVDGAPFGLDLGVATDGENPVLVARIPFCGCDACDDGSAALLAELDGWVLTVARGGVVHARSSEASITRTLDGWSSSGATDREWLEEGRSVPAGVARWAGSAWR